MITAVCLTRFFPPVETEQNDGVSVAERFAGEQAAGIWLLALTALPTIWANTLPSLMGGWMLLAGVWFLLLVLQSLDDWSRHLHKIIWHLLSLFGLWLVGILVSLNGSESLIVGDGTAVTTAILLVAFVQMGVWPAHRWRPMRQTTALPMVWLLHTTPPLIAVTVLVRLALINEMALDGSLGFTALGLFGFLVGVAMSWRYLTQPERAVGWVATAQAGLTFLIGMWGGVEASLAAVHVLVLATGILFLGVKRPLLRPRAWWRYGWRAVAPLLALAAIAGFPLTAGFPALMHLYDGWIQDGGGVLLVVAALLHLLLMTAVYQLIRGIAVEEGEDEDPEATAETPWRGVDMLPDIAVLLLGAMLLANGRWSTLTQLGPVHWLSWLALLVTIGLAVGLSRFLKQEQSIWFNWHEMLPARLPTQQLRAGTLRSVRFVLQACRDAIQILEGETGLLWLLGFLLLFLLL